MSKCNQPSSKTFSFSVDATEWSCADIRGPGLSEIYFWGASRRMAIEEAASWARLKCSSGFTRLLQPV